MATKALGEALGEGIAALLPLAAAGKVAKALARFGEAASPTAVKALARSSKVASPVANEMAFVASPRAFVAKGKAAIAQAG
ncbi:hypothetical protein NL676_035220 [Syzygium grande]|nr:hypothetical protein NL676_035220 [Syzygium grande]